MGREVARASSNSLSLSQTQRKVLKYLIMGGTTYFTGWRNRTKTSSRTLQIMAERELIAGDGSDVPVVTELGRRTYSYSLDQARRFRHF